MKKFLWVFLALFTLTLTGCGEGKEVYRGEGYEFGYDTGKWEFYNEYDNGDIQFVHKKIESTYFTISVIPITGYNDSAGIDINEELEVKKEIHRDFSNNDFKAEIIRCGGQDWIRLEESGGFTQYSGNKGKNSYCITFIPYGNYDKSSKDFEEVFDNFKITE